MKLKLNLIGGIAAAAITIASIASTASAQSLEAIKAAGKIRIGMQVDFPPYGILNTSGQPDGYDADVAKLFAERLGVEAEIVPVTGPNRIPNLLTGRLDALIASLSMTPDRAKQVRFSNPYALVETVIFGRKDLPVKSLADLAGVSVAVPRASAQDVSLTKTAPEGTVIQRFDDDPASTQALLSGQVQAVAAGTTVVVQIEKIAPPDTFETKFSLYQTVFGIAVAPAQEELHNWSNEFVATALADGSLNAIHKKWLGRDLPEMQIPDYIKP
ncbi:MAG: transporter substrate-binding domain-containing protein [Mesorhizobium sp.]